MLTVEQLQAFGANTEVGISRCAKREALYLRLVKTIPVDPSFDKLVKALDDKDLDEAFNVVHGLKGIVANLSLTPLQKPLEEMTELLRAKTDMDYSPYIKEMLAKKEELAELCKE